MYIQHHNHQDNIAAKVQLYILLTMGRVLFVRYDISTFMSSEDVFSDVSVCAYIVWINTTIIGNKLHSVLNTRRSMTDL